jgi:hypothetical protein
MNAWRWLAGRRRAEEDLAREIDAHIAERTDDLIESGLAPADARTQALREFGNKTLQIERSREVWIAPCSRAFGRTCATRRARLPCSRVLR